MRGQGYDAERKVSTGEFTREQRQRLEAYTAATILENGEAVHDRLRVAQYIVTGDVG